MRIEILRKMEYKKDYRIHIMQFGYVFQYLITDRQKNLFQDHITLQPNIWNRIKYKLGLTQSPFPKDQLETGTEIILSGAIGTVDALLKQIKADEDEMEDLRKTAKQRNITECNWRAMPLATGAIGYQCLTHPEYTVRAEEGEKPFHEKPIKGAIPSPF